MSTINRTKGRYIFDLPYFDRTKATEKEKNGFIAGVAPNRSFSWPVILAVSAVLVIAAISYGIG